MYNLKSIIMVLFYVLLYLFLFLAGVSNAFMDKTKNASDWKNSRWWELPEDDWWYKWANPKVSWKNKWKDGKKENGPRFLLSSTFFVFITDCWHFAQSMWRRFIMAGFAVYGIGMAYRYTETETLGMIQFGMQNVLWGNILNVFADILALSIVYLVGFNLFYERVLAKPNRNK